VVALTERGRPGDDQHGPVGPQPDGAVLGAGHAGGTVHEGGEAHAEQAGLVRRPPAGLLGPQLVVADRLEREVQRRQVVTAVVTHARVAVVRKVVGTQQVVPPDLDRIVAELGGEQVDRPLDDGRGLGPPGAAVGDDGRRVGHERAG
jgi:hypothetical protein